VPPAIPASPKLPSPAPLPACQRGERAADTWRHHGTFLYFTAAADLAGGLGVLLPSLTRIKPGLTVAAALGWIALQACAIVFHFSRGEAANTPFNFLLVGLSLFVAWGMGRRRK
jgi:uncharacterized membrane protein YphA (DoxX/SURF4 family)